MIDFSNLKDDDDAPPTFTHKAIENELNSLYIRAEVTQELADMALVEGDKNNNGIIEYAGKLTVHCQYEDGNNRTSSINLKSLVHRRSKAMSKCHIPRQHRHSGTPKCVNRCPGRVNFICCGQAPGVDTSILREQGYG